MSDRKCIYCGADISHRGHRAVVCTDKQCQRTHRTETEKKSRAKAKGKKYHPKAKRYCSECGCDITDRYHTAKVCKSKKCQRSRANRQERSSKNRTKQRLKREAIKMSDALIPVRLYKCRYPGCDVMSPNYYHCPEHHKRLLRGKGVVDGDWGYCGGQGVVGYGIAGGV